MKRLRNEIDLRLGQVDKGFICFMYDSSLDCVEKNNGFIYDSCTYFVNVSKHTGEQFFPLSGRMELQKIMPEVFPLRYINTL